MQLRPTQFFTDGVLDPDACGDRRTAAVLTAAAQRSGRRMRPSDVLYAALAERDAALLSALDVALVDGAAPAHLMDAIDVYNPPGAAYEFDGSRSSVAPELLAALDAFTDQSAAIAAPVAAPASTTVSMSTTQQSAAGQRAAEQRAAGRGAAEQSAPERGAAARGAAETPVPLTGPAVLDLLLACVLAHPDEQDRTFLGEILDLTRAADALRRRVRVRLETPRELFDEGSGRLRTEGFTPDAWAVLERAAERAAALGYDRLLPPHCLLALLGETEGLAERLLRLQLPPQIGLVKAVELISGAFRISDRPSRGTPRLHRDDCGEALHELLTAARRTSALWDADRVDTPHLLAALLDEPPQRLISVLAAEPLRLDLERLRTHLAESLRARRSARPRETAYKLPDFLPPSEDLTWQARTRELPPARHLDRYFGPLCRALHRAENNHVLVTGLPGIGTTTLLRELARRAAAGEIPFLRRKRFLRVDCRDVAAEESGTQLSALISHVKGRTDVVVCVDGLGPLLRGPQGTDHVLELRRALSERSLHLIGVLSVQDYEDLLTADHELQELSCRIDMTEPDRESARDMVRQAGDALAEEFGLSVEDHAVARSVVLAGEFIAHRKLPQSAVRVLRRACEDLHYARTQEGDERAAVTADDVIDVVAELSGVARSQIAGSADGDDRVDYAAALGARVVGQDQAVRVVADELRRIKAGLADASSGPATVLLFAGLTGVGKTELAKAVAGLYSASKRLQTYPMENFTEPHSVAGLIGPPPGYRGHERGGRLINELNADPYCVFLLDEVEKAHPEVLRPFLNLFDEGWIIDQRGVKAHADRAIFLLTTNAGHEKISHHGAHRPDEEIAAAVRARLGELRHRQGEAVFTPEFLARIRRIVVFRPLGEEAMYGIGRLVVERQRALWRERREKDLVVSEELLRYAAKLGHERDVAAQGREGGRVMSPLLTDLVETPVLTASEERPDEFRACARIEVTCVPGEAPDDPFADLVMPRTEVRLVPPEP
ncbi:AAA family ATPase [Streptomyces beihaiensis]|uniref:AAA family ATPase n=1 Tax=Streptomyces beihaiensis TaxID=2984495 RepID=A0ABT3TQE4_9ACTN|nr:AAA family ATPase [Streptomyces beihaiensis]MCX3059231.1 AAA family ATPase [Streptomyces beihaiensis]